MQDSAINLTMKNGTPYQVQSWLCQETSCSKESIKQYITDAVASMSGRSRYQRFASPVQRLSDTQLDYLASLDGDIRVAWFATMSSADGEKGIALARYVKLDDESKTAEFALTVVDEFQGQGIGLELLGRLIETARSNQLEVLRGYILPDNKHMLSLCKRFLASIDMEDGVFRVDIPIPTQAE